MGSSVSNVYVSTFETHVRHLAQQGIARLRPWVMEKSVQSEAHNWDRIGTAEATLKSGRLVATPEQDYPWSRRQTVPAVRHTGDTVEQEDPTQMLVDPTSNITVAMGKAMRRAVDDVIIAAATGDSRDGAGAAVTFPAAQIVGDYTTQLSFDMTTEVTELFMDNDIDPDEEKIMVVGPKQARKLLQLTEATSGDYNAMRPLASKGYVESWMGYSWVVSTRLNAPAGSQLDCFAMTKKAIGLQVNKDIWARIGEDPTKSFVWRLYCAIQCGAIRVEDEHLVWLKVADTI